MAGSDGEPPAPPRLPSSYRPKRHDSGMRRSASVLALVFANACISSLQPQVGVWVFQAPLEGSPMPEGCRLLFSHPPEFMNELQMTRSKDPFHAERLRVQTAGGNVLLARFRIDVPRQDYDCPAASPITNCPPSEGYWATVVFEDYACSRGAIGSLSPSKPQESSSGPRSSDDRSARGSRGRTSAQDIHPASADTSRALPVVGERVAR